jgi:hypothetical protein
MALSRIAGGMLSSLGEPGRRNSTVIASSSARRASWSSTNDAGEVTSELE